jgi:hypothetical protein
MRRESLTRMGWGHWIMLMSGFLCCIRNKRTMYSPLFNRALFRTMCMINMFEKRFIKLFRSRYGWRDDGNSIRKQY